MYMNTEIEYLCITISWKETIENNKRRQLQLCNPKYEFSATSQHSKTLASLYKSWLEIYLFIKYFMNLIYLIF